MNANHSKTKKEKELADNARLLRAWKKFHREQREAVLAGPHGAVLSELFRMYAIWNRSTIHCRMNLKVRFV